MISGNELTSTHDDQTLETNKKSIVYITKGLALNHSIDEGNVKDSKRILENEIPGTDIEVILYIYISSYRNAVNFEHFSLQKMG